MSLVCYFIKVTMCVGYSAVFFHCGQSSLEISNKKKTISGHLKILSLSFYFFFSFFPFFLSFSSLITLYQWRNILKGGYFPYLTYAQNWIISGSLQKLLFFYKNLLTSETPFGINSRLKIWGLQSWFTSKSDTSVLETATLTLYQDVLMGVWGWWRVLVGLNSSLPPVKAL